MGKLINKGDSIGAFRNKLLENGIDIAVDYGEMGLDSFMDEGLLKEVPFIGTIVKLGKISLNVKHLIFARNYFTFLSAVRNDEKTNAELRIHLRELEHSPKRMQEELELLLLYIEQYRTTEKVKYMANIYKVYLKNGLNGISWEQAVTFFELVDRLLPTDMVDLKTIVYQGMTSDLFSDHSGLLRLSSLGLIQYFNGREESIDHDKYALGRLTKQGKLFYRVISDGKVF